MHCCVAVHMLSQAVQGRARTFVVVRVPSSPPFWLIVPAPANGSSHQICTQVLRAQPADLYKFAVQHFKVKSKEELGALGERPNGMHEL